MAVTINRGGTGDTALIPGAIKPAPTPSVPTAPVATPVVPVTTPTTTTRKSSSSGGESASPYAEQSVSAYAPHTHSYSAPTINYTPRTLDQLMAEAQGLIGGEYDAQLLAAKQGYEASQQSLAKAYENTRKTTQDSAVSRGMGRSSYLTDAIANVGLHEKQDSAQLAGNYGDQVMTLEKAQAEAISSYVQQLQRQQEQMALEVALAQAELQYKYDALNASLMDHSSASYSSSGSSRGSSSGSSSKKKGNSTDTATQNALNDLNNLYLSVYKDQIAENQANGLAQLIQSASGEEYARKLYG